MERTYLTNCCGAEVDNYSSDGLARCPLCHEGCAVEKGLKIEKHDEVLFTFGKNHRNETFGIDEGTIVVMEAENPRAAMFSLFGDAWSMQHEYGDLDELLCCYPEYNRKILHFTVEGVDNGYTAVTIKKVFK